MIVLQILKIIGIVLACIIGFVLLVLLLVLFAPVNYSAGVQIHDSDIKVNASAGWLFGIFSVKAGYRGKKFSYGVRAAGISLISSEKSKKEESKPEESEELDLEYFDGPAGPLNEAEENAKTPDREDPSGPSRQHEAAEEYKAADPGPAPQPEQEKKKKERRSPVEIIRERVTSFIQRIRDQYEKTRRIYEKAKTVKYIACAPVTRKALAYAKERLFKLLKSIRPRSIKGSITIGTEDPSQSAFIYGALATVSAQLSKKLYVYPELENKKTDIDVVIRGRIVIGYIALMALQIYTNRDVKRVIRYIRRNLLNGG